MIHVGFGSLIRTTHLKVPMAWGTIPIMMYLAIDRGGKRTGLAVGDDVLKLASPLDVIHTASEDELIRQINIIIKEQMPDALVLGLPLNMDDTEGPSAKGARAFDPS